MWIIMFKTPRIARKPLVVNVELVICGRIQTKDHNPPPFDHEWESERFEKISLMRSLKSQIAKKIFNLQSCSYRHLKNIKNNLERLFLPEFDIIREGFNRKHMKP
jgi:hypothetical protein